MAQRPVARTMLAMKKMRRNPRLCFRWLTFLVVGLSVIPTAQSAETLIGRIVKITYGDTVPLLVGTEQIRVRLLGIDAPAKGQPYGNRAKQALSDIVFGQNVRADDK